MSLKWQASNLLNMLSAYWIDSGICLVLRFMVLSEQARLFSEHHVILQV